MPTPSRRSARLSTKASSTPEPRKITPLTAVKLGSLMERDETPENGPQSNLDTILSSPVAPPNTADTNPTSQFTFTVKTPSIADRRKPDYDEMHPGKAHQSTMKKSDSGLRLGFTDMADLPMDRDVLTANTPSKVNNGLSSNMTSPEFKFTHTESQLSQEAQKIMEGLREEAARIRQQLALERDEQDRKDGEAEQLYTGESRKIARPKGKAGRFSDIHMAEFKKMDSISGHASAYRARPVPTNPPAKYLKRSNSKAGLDDLEVLRSTPKKIQGPVALSPFDSDVPSPTKRLRQLHGGSSSSRPVSRDGTSVSIKQISSNLPRSTSGLPVAVMTPTKASLARSTSVKTLKTTTIHGLGRSPSTKSIAIPNTTGSSKFKSFLPTANNLKSILRRHQPLFSNDPVKIAAGTHVASPGPNINKKLPEAPTRSDIGEFNPASAKKRVGFTPSTKNRHSIATGLLESPTTKNDGYFEGQMDSNSPEIAYPSLPATYPSLPETDFTFTSASTSPSKSPKTQHIFGTNSPTIRRVRPSGISSNLSNRLSEIPSVPMASSFASINALSDLPTVPHGIANKKRKHVDSEDEEEENRFVPEDEPQAKRLKTGSKDIRSSPQKNPVKPQVSRNGAGAAPSSRSPVKPKAKGVLSLSRLNMLSRPKQRH